MAEFFLDRDLELATTSVTLASTDLLQGAALYNDFCLNCPVRNIDVSCTGLAYHPKQLGINAIMPSELESQCGIIKNPDQTIVTRNTFNEDTMSSLFDRLRISAISDRASDTEPPFDPNFTSLVDEWINPEDQEEKVRLQQRADKYNLTVLQVAKIEAGVWLGTYTPAKYGDPRALNLVHEVAEEMGQDDVVKAVIEDFCAVKFDEGISIKQALVVLPKLKEGSDRRAGGMIEGALREILPDSIIVDRRKANEAIEQEFRQDRDEF